MATDGFNNWGESDTTDEINLTRQNEVFSALAGMPETEFLYVNLGAREGAFDVDYTWHRRKYQFSAWWVESDYCPVTCRGDTVEGTLEEDEGRRWGGGREDLEELPEDAADWTSAEDGPGTPGEEPEEKDLTPDDMENEEQGWESHSLEGVFRLNRLYSQAEFRFLEINHVAWRATNAEIVHRLHNGIYNFTDFLDNNYMAYYWMPQSKN
ncbi:MAG: hypothetical protein FWG64_07350 [Firmicutes bacterium]|nr:hypothetical protein [Bacillota bacterium]